MIWGLLKPPSPPLSCAGVSPGGNEIFSERRPCCHIQSQREDRPQDHPRKAHRSFQCYLWLVPSAAPLLTPLPPGGSGDGSEPCLAYWQPHQLQGPVLLPSLEQWFPLPPTPRRCALAAMPHHAQLGSSWRGLNLRWGHHLPRPACSSPTPTPLQWLQCPSHGM